METEPQHPEVPEEQRLDGSRFKQCREQKNLSLAEASQETRILARHLESMESNRWEDLPQPAFTRGFVSTYAQFLGLDAPAFVAAYNRMQGEDSKSLKETLKSSSVLKDYGHVTPPTENLIRFGKIGVLFAFVAAVVLLVFYLLINARKNPLPEFLEAPASAAESLFQQDLKQANASLEAAQPSAESQTELAATDNVTSSTSQNQAQNSAQASTQNPAQNQAQALNPAQANLPAADLAANQNASELVFWVMRPTQIQVTDSAGKVVVSGQQSRGEIKVSGVGPFHLQTDQVQNFDLNINSVPQRLRQNRSAGPLDEVLVVPAAP